jgi:hypothetical protein
MEITGLPYSDGFGVRRNLNVSANQFTWRVLAGLDCHCDNGPFEWSDI